MIEVHGSPKSVSFQPSSSHPSSARSVNEAMFVPDRLKTNAYRVLRLSADATLSEIHKAAASMRRATALGIAGTTEADMPVLGEISRTEAEIRAAIGRLENPVQRISDR